MKFKTKLKRELKKPINLILIIISISAIALISWQSLELEKQYGQEIHRGNVISHNINANGINGQRERVATNTKELQEKNLCELEAVVCDYEKKGVTREVSAYNSVSAQTDNSPCIGATGQNLCELQKKVGCIVASNAYPLYSKIKIDKIGVCTVLDRMNSRYKNRVDVFMDKDIERAVKFGVQRLEVIEI